MVQADVIDGNDSGSIEFINFLNFLIKSNHSSFSNQLGALIMVVLRRTI